jgi:hypothetical protein
VCVPRFKGSGLLLGRGYGGELLEELYVVSRVKRPNFVFVERVVAATLALPDSSPAFSKNKLGFWCCASKGINNGKRVAPLSLEAEAWAGTASNRRRLSKIHGGGGVHVGRNVTTE